MYRSVARISLFGIVPNHLNSRDSSPTKNPDSNPRRNPGSTPQPALVWGPGCSFNTSVGKRIGLKRGLLPLRYRPDSRSSSRA